MKTLCRIIGVSRSNIHARLQRPESAVRQQLRCDDVWILPLIREVVDRRPTYGYRRVTSNVRQACREGSIQSQKEFNWDDWESGIET